MNKQMYAALVKKTASDYGHDDLWELDDDDAIYYYENSMWGVGLRLQAAADALKYALVEVLQPFFEKLYPIVERLASYIEDEEDEDENGGEPY